VSPLATPSFDEAAAAFNSSGLILLSIMNDTETVGPWPPRKVTTTLPPDTTTLSLSPDFAVSSLHEAAVMSCLAALFVFRHLHSNSITATCCEFIVKQVYTKLHDSLLARNTQQIEVLLMEFGTESY